MIGETVGSYRITRRLSSGGMGTVYEAVHTLIERRAAVKVLLPELSRDSEMMQRFFSEAKATAAIGHPGIVEILDFGFDHRGVAYLVMEFLDGTPLNRRLRAGLGLEHALALVEHIVDALGAAHAKGIVHRDLKPGNVMVVADSAVAFGERTKLLDFGIAKLVDNADSGHKTRTGLVMGTPSYMAPEQCRGTGRIDHRADLYAVGCILFRMLCGRPPFVSEGTGEIIGMHLFQPPPRPRTLNPNLDPALEALVLRLLAKSPDARPQSAPALLEELDAVIALLPPSPAPPSSRRSGRGRRARSQAEPCPSTPTVNRKVGEVVAMRTAEAPSVSTGIPAAPEPTPRAGEVSRAEARTPTGPDRTPRAAESLPAARTPRALRPARAPGRPDASGSVRALHKASMNAPSTGSLRPMTMPSSDSDPGTTLARASGSRPVSIVTGPRRRWLPAAIAAAALAMVGIGVATLVGEDQTEPALVGAAEGERALGETAESAELVGTAASVELADITDKAEAADSASAEPLERRLELYEPGAPAQTPDLVGEAIEPAEPAEPAADVGPAADAQRPAHPVRGRALPQSQVRPRSPARTAPDRFPSSRRPWGSAQAPRSARAKPVHEWRIQMPDTGIPADDAMARSDTGLDRDRADLL
ncbi:protein kinase domain-containing protein, partial [Haliangium sp.]|uniref:serine/threonine-protein kinase n=1 Tax=Haliangium sp. TaxID=2663208 RepID=UPI003D0D05F6